MRESNSSESHVPEYTTFSDLASPDVIPACVLQLLHVPYLRHHCHERAKERGAPAHAHMGVHRAREKCPFAPKAPLLGNCVPEAFAAFYPKGNDVTLLRSGDAAGLTLLA
ncbi:hypothetical protein NDU88_001641 [Pleurodeles waltl]|uniref:Uncharacterized protein n=1 Tax=Pleurodeles waltl TaxID=8319 RepID=A0AAV7SZS0_PLEWA|nr:hypothetical protein NDU88_001641 [Pleurodeles waltl]